MIIGAYHRMESINIIFLQNKVFRRKKLVDRPMDLFLVSLQIIRANFLK